MPEAFPFFCCLKPVFGSFLAWRRPLFDFFPRTKCRRHEWGEKSQKAAFFRPKRPKNGLQATEKRKCFRHQFKKMPKKTQLTPNTIFLSIFIFCRTNVRDIYQKYVPLVQVALPNLGYCASLMCYLLLRDAKSESELFITFYFHFKPIWRTVGKRKEGIASNNA